MSTGFVTIMTTLLGEYLMTSGRIVLITSRLLFTKLSLDSPGSWARPAVKTITSLSFKSLGDSATVIFVVPKKLNYVEIRAVHLSFYRYHDQKNQFPSSIF